MNRNCTCLLATAITLALTGCAQNGQPPKTPAANVKPSSEGRPPDPAVVQRDVMNFADRFVASVAGGYDAMAERATTAAAKNAARDRKIGYVTAAYTNAVAFSPAAALLDMMVMARLVRQATEEDPSFAEMFGAEAVASFVTLLKSHEADIWDIGARYLTPEQCDELREVIARWRREHPSERYVAWVRLRDFPQAQAAATADAGRAKGRGSVFSLLFLDPFASLDPTMRQVEQSREMAERVFYYAERLPLVLSWQVESVVGRSLDAPEVQTFTQSSSKLGDSAKSAADSAQRLPQQFREESHRTVEHMAQKLAQERSAAVRQLSQATATERDAALRQANDLIAAQRDAALKQANDVIATQRDAALRQANDVIAAQRDAAIRQISSALDTQSQKLLDATAKRIAAEREALLGQADTSLRSNREGLVRDVEAATKRVTRHVFYFLCAAIVLGVVLTMAAVLILRRSSGRPASPLSPSPSPSRERQKITSS